MNQEQEQEQEQEQQQPVNNAYPIDGGEAGLDIILPDTLQPHAEHALRAASVVACARRERRAAAAVNQRSGAARVKRGARRSAGCGRKDLLVHWPGGVEQEGADQTHVEAAHRVRCSHSSHPSLCGISHER